MLHILFSTLTLVATTLVACGCGGSAKATSSPARARVVSTSASTTATTPAVAPKTAKLASGEPLTRAMLIAKGDKICAVANTKVAAISAHSTQEYGHALQKVGVYYGTEAADLGKLVPPAKMTGDWSQVVNGLHQFREYLNKASEDFLANNERAAHNMFYMALQAQKQVIAIANRDGLKHCTDTN